MVFNLLKRKRVLAATYAECPNCDSKAKVKEWNQIALDTYGKQAPDIRQSALNKQNSFPYQCPVCFKGFSAHKVSFATPESEKSTSRQVSGNSLLNKSSST